MSNLGTPPSILMGFPSIGEAIKNANKNVLQQICVAMGVRREGSRQTLIENLEPKYQNIQDWVNEYQSTVNWISILEQTFRNRPETDSVPNILEPNRIEPSRFSVPKFGIESNRPECQEY